MPEADDPALKSFRALAAETGTWILVGSLLGIATALYSVIRAMRQLNAENDAKGK